MRYAIKHTSNLIKVLVHSKFHCTLQLECFMLQPSILGVRNALLNIGLHCLSKPYVTVKQRVGTT